MTAYLPENKWLKNDYLLPKNKWFKMVEVQSFQVSEIMEISEVKVSERTPPPILTRLKFERSVSDA